MRPGRTAAGPGAAVPGAPARAAMAAVVAGLLLAPLPAAPQEDALQRQIQESQRRLQQIRGEREQLRRELENLTGQVHSVSEELENIERQIGSSASVVAELNTQLGALSEQVDVTTRDMLWTRDRLTARNVVLRRRLREIYKRGPLAPIQVLLSADSFSDLIHRYKYLHQVALFDRLLVREVGRLERELEEQRERLAQELEQLSGVRSEKARELADLERLEQQRQRRLAGYTQRRSQARTRLAQLADEEERLRNAIVELERARRERERAAGAPSASTLRTSDLGTLNWPVEGAIVYGFGPQRDGGSTSRRDGIGIGAEAGTPVRAVEAGRVEYAGPRSLYGQSVIVSHGGGYYSVYLYMQSLAVSMGQEVGAGQVLGRVGGSGSPEGPHLEFQIWEPGGGGMPRPVDPVRWLRSRS